MRTCRLIVPSRLLKSQHRSGDLILANDSSITTLSWSSDCESISSRQTSLGESTKPTVRPANVARLYGGALLEHVWDAVLDDFAIRACLFSAARENEPKRR